MSEKNLSDCCGARLGVDSNVCDLCWDECTPISKEEWENQALAQKVIAHYKSRGYTESKNFPNEYLLLVNPSTMKRVRLYYNGKVFES